MFISTRAKALGGKQGLNYYPPPLPDSHPQQVPHEYGEADGEGGRAQAAVTPLVGHGKDADDELQREEHLHGGGHANADARLQLLGQWMEETV